MRDINELIAELEGNVLKAEEHREEAREIKAGLGEKVRKRAQDVVDLIDTLAPHIVRQIDYAEKIGNQLFYDLTMNNVYKKFGGYKKKGNYHFYLGIGHQFWKEQLVMEQEIYFKIDKREKVWADINLSPEVNLRFRELCGKIFKRGLPRRLEGVDLTRDLPGMIAEQYERLVEMGYNPLSQGKSEDYDKNKMGNIARLVLYLEDVPNLLISANRRMEFEMRWQRLKRQEQEDDILDSQIPTTEEVTAQLTYKE